MIPNEIDVDFQWIFQHNLTFFFHGRESKNQAITQPDSA